MPQDEVLMYLQVTDAVHAKGSYIFAQLWALGRAADPKTIQKYGYGYVGASDIPLGDYPAPRPLRTEGEFFSVYVDPTTVLII